MQGKHEFQYIDVFEKLNALHITYNPQMGDLCPQAISCDYELGLIKSIKYVYPGVIYIRCHFHFLQNQNKRIRKKNQYPFSNISVLQNSSICFGAQIKGVDIPFQIGKITS